MNSLGSRIRFLRKKRRWTLEETAKKLGLKAFSTYSNWEYDRREPDTEMITKIADLFDVSVQWLLTGDQIDVSEETYAAALLGYDERRKKILEWLKEFSDDEVEYMLRTAELIRKSKPGDDEK